MERNEEDLSEIIENVYVKKYMSQITEKELREELDYYIESVRIKKAYSDAPFKKLNLEMSYLNLEAFCKIVIKTGGDLERFSSNLLQDLYFYSNFKSKQKNIPQPEQRKCERARS